MVVWVLYSTEPPFLPICVTDTSIEMAARTGLKQTTVKEMASRADRGVRQSRIRRVDIGDMQ